MLEGVRNIPGARGQPDAYLATASARFDGVSNIAEHYEAAVATPKMGGSWPRWCSDPAAKVRDPVTSASEGFAVPVTADHAGGALAVSP
jgi:hypothetical protein